jgi:phosphoglycolate phosphatase-like HAD superfamily hydrolase
MAKDQKRENEEDVTLEEMSAVLQEMLKATLYFAGVKKAKLDEAADVYLDAIDEVFGEEEEGMLGVDEVVKVIEHLKKNNPELFGK